MQLVINGEAKSVEAPVTLEALLARFGYESRAVAVAMNGQFVPRKDYATRLLDEGQSLEIVSPMQGG